MASKKHGGIKENDQASVLWKELNTMAKSESLERMPGFNAGASLYKTSVTARGRVDDRPSTARSTASSAIFLASHWECTYNARLGGCQCRFEWLAVVHFYEERDP